VRIVCLNRELFDLEVEVIGLSYHIAFEGIKIARKFCKSWCTVT